MFEDDLFSRKKNEMEKSFYHLYANGADAKNFIVSDEDCKYEFNLFGICTVLSRAVVVAFSIEDTHIHALLYGTQNECYLFKHHFEDTSIRHIISSRGTKDGVCLELTLDLIDTEDYLMNVAAYVVIQPTKDGKRVMQYDYLWSSASMYFRPANHIPIWMVGNNGEIKGTTSFMDLNKKMKQKIAGSRSDIIPACWQVCDGLILPSNYVDVNKYESIFKTHNCFRVFCSSGKNKNEATVKRMAQVRGVNLEDYEARDICRRICRIMYGKETARYLTSAQRLSLALELRRKHNMSMRQISTLCRLPQEEIVKYL